MIKQELIAALSILCFLLIISINKLEARSITNEDNNDQSINAVIPPTPINKDFNQDGSLDETAYNNEADDDGDDIIRRQPITNEKQQLASASNEATVPIYVSPFVRTESKLSPFLASNGMPFNFDHQESSHSPPNFLNAPKQQQQQQQASSLIPSQSTAKDLKTSASYGHHHGGHHHYDHDDASGYMDIGVWTKGKGSFGYYTSYPVGSSKHYGY